MPTKLTPPPLKSEARFDNWVQVDLYERLKKLEDFGGASFSFPMTAGEARDLTDGGDSPLHYHADDRRRANHTGTQLSSTISDLDAVVRTMMVGQVTDHALLLDLAWTGSGHTGTASRLAGFSGAGAAAEYSLGTGVATFLATPSSANLRAALTDETGSGAAYFQGGDLGTPAGGVLTNCAGLPISSGVSGLGAGVATFLATPSSANLRGALTDETGSGVAVFNDTPTLIAPLLGTPTSGNLANCTGYPTSALGGLGAGVATFLATPSSANFAAAVTDETGTAGKVVFSASPTFTGNVTLSANAIFDNAMALEWKNNGGTTRALMQLFSDNNVYIDSYDGSMFLRTGTTPTTALTITTGQAATFAGALGATGDFAVNTNKFTVAASSGNTVAAGTLDVTGAVTGPSFTDSKGELRNIPQNSKSAAYTTVLSDAGKHIFHPSADVTARTFTIDSNANVAYPVGTAITFVNQHTAGVVTIAITSDTMRLAPSGATGSRTLAANGIATAVKVATTEWIVSGTGLS